MPLRLHSILAVSSAAVLACAGCGGDGSQRAASSQPGAPSASSAPQQAGDTELFSGDQPWTKDVSGSPLSERSGAIIQTLADLGGWGNDNNFQIDFSLPIFFADTNTQRLTVTGSEDYCFGGPDCDPVPAQMPVPDDANFEGSQDLSCDPSVDDCHLLVAERDERKLYEVYHGNKVGDDIVAQGFFVWDLNKTYPDSLRGEQCTSADAAGFPIAALTPTADEVAAGEINHAIRFILPNDRMKQSVYVPPATHAGGPASENPDAPPYGVRFRLRSDFDETGFNDAERVVLKALKSYGMLLSDGGEIALTFASDRNGTAKWADLGIDAASFKDVTVDQFDVVDLDQEVELTYDCVLNP